MIETRFLKANKIILPVLFFILLLSIFSTAMAKKEKKSFSIKKDSMSLPRTATTSDDITIIPLGTAEFPGFCKYRGHIGKVRCTHVTATKHERYSCKGKGVYYSKVGGKKYCYTCPSGYKRASATRKMNHDKACEKHQKGRNAYAPAESKVDNVKSCDSGEFKHKGICKSCPAKTNRKHIAGIDNGKCKVKKEYHCNTGLSLHKAAPKSIWSRGGNWLGLKNKKLCGLPFDMKAYGKEIIESEANKQTIQGVILLGEALANATGASKTKVENIKKAIKKNKLDEAYQLLSDFPEFEALKADLAESGDAFQQSGEARSHFALTIGFVVDGSFVAGGNFEFGLGYDVASGSLKKYKSYGLTKGVSIAVDGAVSVGIWKGDFVDSYTQGYTIEAPIISLGYAVGAGVGVGVWSDYYTPKRADGLNQPHFVGLSGSFGVGSGFQFGEYAEVWTDVKD